MQKVLQKNSSSPLLCTSLNANLFMSFTTSMAITPTTATLPKVKLTSPLLSSITRTTCRCSITGPPKLPPFRVRWSAARPAWFCTLSSQEQGPVGAAVSAIVTGGEEPAEMVKGENVTEEKYSKTSRKQKGTASGGEIEGNADLLTIPGIGVKNLRKLVEKGFTGTAELKQLYRDKFLGKANETMVEYLQSSVGIIHRNHAESITTFIKESVDEELKDSNSNMSSKPKKRITFCVEGNISVGKSTFLKRIVGDTIELRDLVEVVPEPVDKWQNVGPNQFNILNAFYEEPQRYAYTFQNYVFVTRVMQERESSGGLKPLRLMERSIFSDRMVFVRAVHEAKWMNGMEISIYDSWFDPVVSALPGLIPDGFIYLRASPDTCHKRMKLRKREEEDGVSLDYLRGLHEKHESWLFPSESGDRRVLSVSELPSGFDNTLHPNIRDRVFYLEGDHMHSCIQKVPALVLDCETNIDFSRDIEAKEHYASQVSEFFKYVKKEQELSTAKSSNVSNVAGKKLVSLPNEGGLLLPNGLHFPEAPLNSLDFNGAMPFMARQ